MEKEKDDFSVDFLDKNRQKEFERKMETGEITCNLDSPEDCEACGS